MLKWLLFDLNSFFASCEQQEDPSLRGRPVAVVPSLADSTSVIAASYEAKKFGIKTNTKVGDAKKMCPGLVLKKGNHRIYTHYHEKIIKACEEVLPIKKVMSIDEVACELIGREREFDTAKQIAQKMKDHVRQVVGSEIKSSVGVGPNILVAKIASDMQKPDGLVLVETDKISEKLGPLPIEAIPGIGRNMKCRLNQKGYFHISDLLAAPEYELRKHWGNIWGLRVARELRGDDISSKRDSVQKSMSHQHVLPPKLRSHDQALQILVKLLMKAGVRLREEKLKTCGLGVRVKYLGENKFEDSISFGETDDSLELVANLRKLWKGNPYLNQTFNKPFKVSIVLTNLTQGPEQLSLFENQKNRNINQALDIINSRYGPNTLFLASTKDILGHAKTRISFTHVPKLSDELED